MGSLLFLLFFDEAIMRERSPIYVGAAQIRAARALLDWSQEELAEASNLYIPRIRKIESGHISPRDKTMDAIVTSLEQVKIEFLTSGVRLQTNDIVAYEGDDCYLQLLDDIYQTTKGKKEEVLFIHADNRLVTNEEIQSLVRTRKNGVRWRFLCEEDNTYLHYPIDEYRWIPKKFCKRSIQLIYGSKVAMGVKIDKSRNLTTKIVVMDSVPLADSLRNLFELVWESCRKPPFTTAPKVFE